MREIKALPRTTAVSCTWLVTYRTNNKNKIVILYQYEIIFISQQTSIEVFKELTPE